MKDEGHHKFNLNEPPSPASSSQGSFILKGLFFTKIFDTKKKKKKKKKFDTIPYTFFSSSFFFVLKEHVESLLKTWFYYNVFKYEQKINFQHISI